MFSSDPRMSSDNPCLRVAIDRLTATGPDHYAIWVLQAPSQAGLEMHDSIWTPLLQDNWEAWRDLFSARNLPDVPRIPTFFLPPPTPEEGTNPSYTGRMMEHFGISLWRWVFDGPIQTSFAQSQGIAFGQGKPLRLRLEIRDPELIELPWEIMKPQTGMQVISLSQQVLFSRTTNEVAPLPELRVDHSLNILLVLGQDGSAGSSGSSSKDTVLQLEREAEVLPQVLESSAQGESVYSFMSPVPCKVDTLVQPTPAQLTEYLETRKYNVLFYSGHGMPAPDGGLLFLRPDTTINGTELAQVLTRFQVKLAVFNACWGAQPEIQNGKPMPRSSLAEVLIHHGVPAVLGMRDSIADHEALSFIQMFARSLAERSPIDEAVAIARQHLLTLYRFNHITWTLPVLYMHPDFDGELVKPQTEGMTEIPDMPTNVPGSSRPTAFLRSIDVPSQYWTVYGGKMSVGCLEGNDLVLKGRGVSRKHAEIFYKDAPQNEATGPTYYLRDFSRFGTLLLGADGTWRKVHEEVVPLKSHTRIKFGIFQLEFVVEEAVS